MRTSLRKIGNSYGIILAKKLMEKVGIQEGTEIDIQVKDGSIAIKPILNRRPINRDLSTWEQQIKKALAEGQTLDIGYWPDHISPDPDDYE